MTLADGVVSFFWLFTTPHHQAGKQHQIVTKKQNKEFNE